MIPSHPLPVIILLSAIGPGGASMATLHFTFTRSLTNVTGSHAALDGSPLPPWGVEGRLLISS